MTAATFLTTPRISRRAGIAKAAMGNKALIAMSGGVDSSVAAYLTQRDGFQCLGVTMKLFSNEDLGRASDRTCCSLDDVEDARNVARHLGIPYYVFNFSQEFKTQVMDRFAAAYEGGETPNPCIDCNRCLKFDRLFQRARELGCEALVTGHYARIEERSGRYLLRKARDESKDQSYFLYTMTQSQLAHTRFPLGELTKGEVRKIAEAQGFRNAHKRDSQDICFVPGGDYGRFLENHTGRRWPGGEILDPRGRVLGRHRGAVRYTIGQRKGLGLAADGPLYVWDKDMEKNTLTVGPEEGLYRREVFVREVNWILTDRLTAPRRFRVKLRSRQREQEAEVFPLTDGTLRLVFDAPQRAPAPGQAAVFYEGDYVAGGGRLWNGVEKA